MVYRPGSVPTSPELAQTQRFLRGELNEIGREMESAGGQGAVDDHVNEADPHPNKYHYRVPQYFLYNNAAAITLGTSWTPITNWQYSQNLGGADPGDIDPVTGVINCVGRDREGAPTIVTLFGAYVGMSGTVASPGGGWVELRLEDVGAGVHRILCRVDTSSQMTRISMASFHFDGFFSNQAYRLSMRASRNYGTFTPNPCAFAMIQYL